MSLIFNKTNVPIRKDKVFIHLTYMGGDADSWHPEEIELENISFKEKDSQYVLDEIEKWRKFQIILDENYESKYELIESEYGLEIARMWENVPFDPNIDYQIKTRLYSIKVLAYDKNGQEYVALLY